jgi:hypothetical protein
MQTIQTEKEKVLKELLESLVKEEIDLYHSHSYENLKKDRLPFKMSMFINMKRISVFIDTKTDKIIEIYSINKDQIRERYTW